MREIFFRGKTAKGEWVVGDLLNLHNGDKYIVNNKFGACIDDKGNFINTESPFVCKVISETVGQFTGLTDKSGKKIFEGDIVKAIVGRYEFKELDSEKVYVGKMIFDDACFWLQKYGGGAPYAPIWWDSELEVLGNVFDNPELWEKDNA